MFYNKQTCVKSRSKQYKIWNKVNRLAFHNKKIYSWKWPQKVFGLSKYMHKHTLNEGITVHRTIKLNIKTTGFKGILVHA